MFDGVHLRLTLTRGVKFTSGMDPRLNVHGPTLIVLAEHKAPVYGSGGLALVTSSVRRFPPDCLDPKIHHNNLIQSIMAKIEANVAGADDAFAARSSGDSSPRPTRPTCSSSKRTCAHAASRGLSRGNHASDGAGLVRETRHCARGDGPDADRELIAPTKCSAPARWVNSPP
jgi:hypothetical protein